jgi:hypothetical protein
MLVRWFQGRPIFTYHDWHFIWSVTDEVCDSKSKSSKKSTAGLSPQLSRRNQEDPRLEEQRTHEPI